MSFRPMIRFPFYPLLIGPYAVVFLFSVNLGQVPPEDALSSMGAAFLYSLGVLALCLLVIRRRHKAAIAAGILLLVFFSYGHVLDLLGSVRPLGLEIGFFKLVVIVLAIAAALLWLAMRAKGSLENFTVVCNVAIGFLLVMVLVRVIPYEFKVANLLEEGDAEASQVAQSLDGQPDIYYIVLDGYARADMLLEKEGFDNSPFLAQLEKRGFTVVDCAFSNYPNTTLSMVSSLNMNYIKPLGFEDSDFFLEDGNPVFHTLTHENLVRKEFANFGYQFAAFKGFFPINDIQDADYYFDYSEDQEWSTGYGEGNFQHLAAKTTLLRVLMEMIHMNPEREIWDQLPMWLYTIVYPNGEQLSSRSYQWYNQHMFAFEKLQTIPDLSGSVLVYAHIYATHQPFVLREDGSFLWPVNEDNNGYLPAVKYVNTRILEVIDTIVEKSSVPPIIILQADHGSYEGLDHYKILSAYSLPGIDQPPHETITPVNTFRFILKHYFNAPYDLLPDNIQVADKNALPAVIEDIPAECGK